MTVRPTNADNLKETGPRQPSAPKGARRFAPFTLRRKSGGWQVQVYWARLGVTLVILGLFGWISAASGAYFFVKYKRGFTEVKFTDMLLLPVRWDEHQVARGDFLIKKAQEDLKEQKFREAFHALRIGLIKSPGNKEGRLFLAKFYGLWKRPDLARRTLLEGFEYHKNDPDYLKTLFSFLLQQQDDEQVLAYYNELLANDPAVTPRNQLVALAAASACYFRGNYDQAETILHRYHLAGSRDGRVLTARIAWDRGSKDQAIALLRELASDLPKDEEIYAQIITYLRSMGRDEEARRESFVRSLADPQNARARIDQLYAYHKDGDTEAIKTHVEEVFRDFSTNSNALVALADFAANSGNAQLARRVHEHAKANDLNWEATALMTIEAHIVAKQYQSALEMVRELQKENPDWGKRFYAVFNGLQAIAHFGLGDAEAAQLFLTNFLTQANVRAENLTAVSNRLMDVGAKSQARQVLQQAVESDPLNQAALTRLIQLDLDLNNTEPLAGNVRTLLTMRKPSKDVLNAAYRKLSSDLFIFSPDRTALLQDLREAIGGAAAKS